MRSLLFFFAACGPAGAIFGACSDWSSLYGTDCNGAVIPDGDECIAGQGNDASGGVDGLGGDAGAGGREPFPLMCGNGVVDPGEVCDDGNTEGDDSCLSGCSWATCGDGFQRRGVEDCDDGNVAGGDSCGPTCLSCNEEGSFFRPGTGHCYVRHDEALSFDEARAVCGLEGGYLVTSTSSTEAGIVKRRFGGDDRELWLGLRLQAGEPLWLTGETSGELPWVDGEPTNLDCGVQFGSATSDENFRSIACDEKRTFVCEREPARTDPTTHHAYRRWFVETTRQGATDFCASEGGALVSLESEEERAYVFNLFRSEFWTAGQRSASDGYRWEQDSSLVSANDLAEGADTSDGNDCLFHSAGELFAGPCSVERGLLCEFF